MHGEDGRPLSFPITLIARDELVLCFEVVRSAGTTRQAAYDLTDHAFRFGLKESTKLHINQKLAFSDVDQINLSGDWSEADLSEGKLSVRVNLNTETIESLFESQTVTVDCVGEIEAEKDNKPSTLVQFAVRLLPDVIRLQAPPPASGQPPFPSSNQLDIAPGWKLVVDEHGIHREAI